MRLTILLGAAALVLTAAPALAADPPKHPTDAKTAGDTAKPAAAEEAKAATAKAGTIAAENQGPSQSASDAKSTEDKDKPAKSGDKGKPSDN